MGKDMHAFIRGKDVGFSAGRFYGGVADLLAGVEEEEGYVVDGQWVGWDGKEERKKASREAARAEEVVTGAVEGEVSTEGMKRTASDKERRRMEEILHCTPSPSPSPPPCPRLSARGSSSPSPPEEEDEHLEMHTRTRVVVIPTQGERGLGDTDADMDMEDVQPNVASQDMTEVFSSDSASDSVLQFGRANGVEGKDDHAS
jgi:triacylglycerol lipase